MIVRGADPGGATGRPRSRSLNLDDPTRLFHAAEPFNPGRATSGGFERSINSSTLCPENRARYSARYDVEGVSCGSGSNPVTQMWEPLNRFLDDRHARMRRAPETACRMW